jgi:hypothetical protein
MPIGHMPPLQQSITFVPQVAAHDAASIGAQSIAMPIRHTHAPNTRPEAAEKCRGFLMRQLSLPQVPRASKPFPFGVNIPSAKLARTY